MHCITPSTAVCKLLLRPIFQDRLRLCFSFSFSLLSVIHLNSSCTSLNISLPQITLTCLDTALFRLCMAPWPRSNEGRTKDTSSVLHMLRSSSNRRLASQRCKFFPRGNTNMSQMTSMPSGRWFKTTFSNCPCDLSVLCVTTTLVASRARCCKVTALGTRAVSRTSLYLASCPVCCKPATLLKSAAIRLCGQIVVILRLRWSTTLRRGKQRLSANCMQDSTLMLQTRRRATQWVRLLRSRLLYMYNDN